MSSIVREALFVKLPVETKDKETQVVPSTYISIARLRMLSR